MIKLKDKIMAYYKSLDNDKKILFWGVLLSVIITLLFIIKLCFNGFWIWGNELKMDVTGQFGDFIGGVVGTIFSGLGFYFLYVTLVEQRTAINNQQAAFEKERFDSKFYELLKMHRENVSEFKFDTRVLNEEERKWQIVVTENKGVLIGIYNQFVQCQNELKFFFKGTTRTYNSNYLKQISHLNLSNDYLNLMAKIDICYSIVFYGVGAEGLIILQKLFREKYKQQMIDNILRYISLKPANDDAILSKWLSIPKGASKSKKILITNEIFETRKKTLGRTQDFLYISENYHNRYIKYYGGHQFRLGHYYRHLFQIVNFVNSQSKLPYKLKYDYIRTLRAQLSTHEQMLLFLNSLASMGRIWEINFEQLSDLNDYSPDDFKLITKYNLIKNIPGEEIFGIPFKMFYPYVEYEGDVSKPIRPIYK